MRQGLLIKIIKIDRFSFSSLRFSVSILKVSIIETPQISLIICLSYIITIKNFAIFLFFFFPSGFFLESTDDLQDSRRRACHFYSYLPLPPSYKDLDICLQLQICDKYLVFLIASYVLSIQTLRKKRSFPLGISSVNVTKS